MTYLLIVYGSTQFLTATDSPQASSVALRDGQGYLSGVGLEAGTLGLEVLSGPVFLGGETTKTTTYAVGASDYLIPLDPTGGAFAVNLPPVGANNGRELVFKNAGTSTNAVTLTASGAETIDGATTLVMNTSHAHVRLWCDGTTWLVI